MINIENRAFYDDFSESLLITDYIFDSIFWLEIISNFFSAYTKRTRVYKKFTQIAHQYMM